VIGNFVGGKLVNYSICRPEWGLDFYAPQTFMDGQRRIMIGWMYHWGKEVPEGCPFAGALSIPRELRLVGDQLFNFPVLEVRYLLRGDSPFVRREGDILILSDMAGNTVRYQIPGLRSFDILEDTKSLEVFINGGEMSFTRWLN